MSVFDHENGEWSHCFSINQELDFHGYFLVSASSGLSVSDSVVLNSLKVFDPMKANTNHHFQDSHEKKAEHQHFADTIASKVNDLIHDRKSD